MKKIFISYGRDYLRFYPERVARDLELVEKENFSVSIDNRMEKSVMFDEWIQKNIDESDYILFFMSKHSTRRPDGVCLDEIAYARSISKPIIPILIEDCQPPFLVSRINWLDVRTSIDRINNKIIESKFRTDLDNIISAINNGITDDLITGTNLNLLNKFRPFDFSLTLANNNSTLTKRTRFIDSFNNWLTGNKPILLVSAHSGTGKSYLSSFLGNEDNRVKGIHFCQNYNFETGVAKRILMNLAYNMCTQDEKYRRLIEENIDFSELDKYNTTKLFHELFIKCVVPLELEQPYVLIIDGIDEASAEEIYELGSVLHQNCEKIPNKLKFLITSRPEMEVKQSFSFVEKYELENDKEDLREYIINLSKQRKIHINKEDEESIIDLSQGNFLYIRTLFDLIKGDSLNLDDVKNGIASVFSSSFERFFKDIDYQKLPRKLLQILVALKESVDIKKIVQILNVSEYEIHELLVKFGSLLENKDGKINLYHKSLADWLTDQTNTRYFVSVSEGDKQICDWIEDNLYCFMFDEYIERFGLYHLFNSKRYDVIFDILETYGDELDDSLCVTLVRNTAAKNTPEVAKFISDGFKRNKQEFPLRKIIRHFVEYGHYPLIGRLFIQLNKEEQFNWILPYSQLIQNRINVKIEEAYNTPEDDFVNAPVEVYAEYFYYKAEASRELGKYEESYSLYKKATEICPNASRFSYYMSLIKMADVQFVFGNYEEALKLALSIEIDTKNVEGNFAKERVLGHIYKSIGNYEEAFNHYDNALRIARGMGKMYAIVESLNSISTVVSREKAIDFLNNAIKLGDPKGYKLELGKSYYELGMILLKKGEVEQALINGYKSLEYQTDVKYMGGICSSRYLIANCLLKQQKYEEAKELVILNIKEKIISKVSAKSIIRDFILLQLTCNGLSDYNDIDFLGYGCDYLFDNEVSKNALLNINLSNRILREYTRIVSSDYKIGYHNQNHIIEVDGRKFILRIPVDDFDVVDIRVYNENNILEFLDKNKTCIVHPSFVGNGVIDNQVVSIHTFIEGSQLREVVFENVQLNDYYVLQFVAFFKKLHSIHEKPYDSAIDYLDVHNFYDFDRTFIKNLVTKWFNKYKELYISLGFPDDITILLPDDNNLLIRNKFSLTHCDVHRGNIIVQPNNEFAFLDWELAQFTDPLYDIAIHFHKMFYSKEQEELFLKEYAKFFNYTLDLCINQIAIYRKLEDVKSCVIDIIRLLKEIDEMPVSKRENSCDKYLLKLKALEESHHEYKCPFANADELYKCISKFISLIKA